MYETGSGVERDESKAAFWYQKSAEGKWVIAQFRLAALYARGGEILPKDPALAKKWLQIAQRSGAADLDAFFRRISAGQPASYCLGPATV